MLLLRFERSLLRLSAAKPQLEPLFQLPPRNGSRVMPKPDSLFLVFQPSTQHAADLIDLPLPDFILFDVNILKAKGKRDAIS